MLTEVEWRAVGLSALIAAGVSAAALLALLAWLRRRRELARPVWHSMLADTEYFQQSMVRVFQAKGYRVLRSWSVQDRIERQEREVVLALSKRGETHAALCGRWVIPITSEIVSRFENALAQTQARQGWIVTTSYFTPAAKAQAESYEVELVDGAALQKWITEIW